MEDLNFVWVFAIVGGACFMGASLRVEDRYKAGYVFYGGAALAIVGMIPPMVATVAQVIYG